MRRRTTAAAAAAFLLLALGACTADGISGSPDATSAAPEIDSHESGPASPIAYGLVVPTGAVQLGPLVRYRSERLIEAYKPELEAVQAENALEEEREQASEPTPSTPSTTPTEDNKPEGDAFEELENPPKPDTFVSLMRINGQPTVVVRRLLAELSVLLPDAGIVTDDLAEYCKATDRRVTGCALDLTGTTPGGRDLHIQLTVDPGDVTTRTGNVASLERPVMTLTVANVGDPRAGQEDRSTEEFGDLPDTETTEQSGWIWPKMDEDAPADGPVIDGYTPPTSATVLLSGTQPQFATMTTLRASIATEITDTFTSERLGDVTPKRDVISDLNEVIVTTWGTAADGTVVRTVHTLSARGNYLSLFVTPKS